MEMAADAFTTTQSLLLSLCNNFKGGAEAGAFGTECLFNNLKYSAYNWIDEINSTDEYILYRNEIDAHWKMCASICKNMQDFHCMGKKCFESIVCEGQ